MKKVFTLLMLVVCLGTSSIFAQTDDIAYLGTNDALLSRLESDRTSSPTLYFHQIKQQLVEMGSPLPHVGLGDITQTGREQFLKNLQNFHHFTALYDSLALFNRDFGNNLVHYLENDEVVTGYQLHVLTKMFILYHHLTYKALQFQSLYAPGHGPRSADFINPQNEDETLYNLIWLASHVLVVDKVVEGHDIYFKKIGKLRRILKSAFKISEHTERISEELRKMALFAVGKENRKQMKKYVQQFKAEYTTLLEMGKTNQDIRVLTELIHQNPQIENLSKGEKIKLKGYGFVDAFARVGEKVVDALSGFFGNVAGAIRWRKGYMIHQTAFHEELRKKLRPMDIIFEKTPFALTDTFIPGYFGHAAIWLGTEQEMKELGVWDHPSVKKYHDQIKDGYYIVESLRPGVSMNTLQGWMNIDSIAIMRVPNVLDTNDIERGEYYEKALRHMGKDYDFNFDVTTLDKIVCSELIYHTFGDIKFPTRWRLGRPTIEPDNLAAVNYYDNSPVEFIQFTETENETEVLRREEKDLGKELKFLVNEERSTPEDTAYDFTEKKCRRMKVPGKKRKRRVCTTERIPMVYEAPDDLISRIPPLPLEN